jgi:hypothetical protein
MNGELISPALHVPALPYGELVAAWCRDRLVGAEELSGVGDRPFRPLLPVDPERAFQAQPAPSSPYSAPAA